MKKEVYVLKLNDESIKRLTSITEKVIDILDKECKSLDEKAFCLRVLMETFEETYNAIVPFKNRYTEPVYNYQKKGTEEWNTQNNR